VTPQKTSNLHLCENFKHLDLLIFLSLLILAYDSLFVTGLQDLIETLQKFAFIPERHISSPFLFAIDHCFGVRGQGTVMTGTVLQGTVNINDVCVVL
jgi:selenocysteine-specific elongation factor